MTKEVPLRQKEAYIKLLDDPHVYHAGRLIWLSEINKHCQDVGKTAF